MYICLRLTFLMNLQFTNKCESIHPGNSGVKHSVDKLWQKYKNADPEYINTHFFRRLLTKKFKLIDKSPIFALKIITEELAANKVNIFNYNITGIHFIVYFFN